METREKVGEKVEEVFNKVSAWEKVGENVEEVFNKKIPNAERGSIGDVGVGEDADEFSKGVRAAEEDNSGTTQFELVFTFSVALRLNQTCCQLRERSGTKEIVGAQGYKVDLENFRVGYACTDGDAVIMDYFAILMFAQSGGEQSAARLLRDHVLIGHSSNAFGILCKQARWPVATKTASGSLLAKRMLVSLSHDQTNGVEDQKEASIGPG
ncbi:hypothetical protein Tco_0846154 [Tanacetum coccineum]